MLSAYHELYQGRSDEEIDFRIKVKELGLRQVLAVVGVPEFVLPTLRVAVFGCGDRRFVARHRQMFESIFSKPAEVTTFDVTTEHLQGEADVIQHDVALPVPGGPFDIVYADVLARFLDPAKQYSMMKNAYDVLAPGGMAIVTFAKEDFDPPPDYEPIPGTSRVDMNALQFELAGNKIEFLEVPVTLELVPPKKDHKITIEDLVLVLKK